MLRNEIDVDKITLNDDFALNFICDLFNEYHRIMLIDTLLQKNVDINISNHKDQTTLMNDRLASVEVHELIAHEIDLEIVNVLERSALHKAISANNLSIIEALLECHIDILIRDKENDTIRFYLDTTKCSNNIKSRAQILQLLDKKNLKNK